MTQDLETRIWYLENMIRGLEDMLHNYIKQYLSKPDEKGFYPTTTPEFKLCESIQRQLDKMKTQLELLKEG